VVEAPSLAVPADTLVGACRSDDISASGGVQLLSRSVMRNRFLCPHSLLKEGIPNADQLQYLQ
jgi:hypothetical protein